MIMNMKFLLKGMVKELSNHFLAMDDSKNQLNKKSRIENRIYFNFWEKNILEALMKHDFEIHPLTCENLANWLLRYLRALCCENPTNLQRKRFKMCNKPELYPPRNELLKALSDGRLKDVCQTLGKSTCNIQLNNENFLDVFQLLLEMEDAEVLLEYLPLVYQDIDLVQAGFNAYCAEIKQSPNDRSILDVVSPEIDEAVIVSRKSKVDTTLMANRIKILLPCESDILTLPVATVKDIMTNKIYLETEKVLGKKNTKSVDLVIRPTRNAIRFQHRALSLLLKNSDMRKFLYPDCDLKKKYYNVKVQNMQLINEEIYDNPEQLLAIRKIVSGQIASNAPFIIFGPPGTGKTTTIVEAILQLRLLQPKSRILVTAGSNSVCDTIALRICEYFESSECLEKHLEKTTVLPLLRIYSKSILKRYGLNKFPQLLRENSNLRWDNGHHAYPAVEDIHRYGIIICTLATVGKLVCGNVSSENFFTHVFIDEASAVSEPETLVGIVGIKNTINDSCHIILCGDHKQLGPVIKSKKAVKFGLEKSLMERLMNRKCYAVDRKNQYDHSLQIRLRRNYRSHPEIVNLFNHLYYDNQLIPLSGKNEKHAWSVLTNSKFPIAFHAIQGEMSVSGTSSFNLFEIDVLLMYVEQLLVTDDVKQSDIGIVTPYNKQSEIIQERLNQKNWSKIEVGSVNYFQGREKTVVIASMVRSQGNGLGFVRNPQRFNVLISRPKSLLLILGNPRTLSQFRDIKYVIDKCKQKQNYFEGTNKYLTAESRIKRKLKSKKENKKIPINILNDQLCIDKDEISSQIEKTTKENKTKNSTNKKRKYKKSKKAQKKENAKKNIKSEKLNKENNNPSNEAIITQAFEQKNYLPILEIMGVLTENFKNVL